MTRAAVPVALLLGSLLVPGEAAAHGIVISEVLCDPPPGLPQFIELSNTSAEAVDLGGWALSGGAAHTFPQGFRLPGLARCVLAADLDRFRTAYGFAPDGVFLGNLPKTGGSQTLRDERGEFVARAEYAAEPGSLARGGGASLVLRAGHVDGADPPA
ncbi:MAG: lamin tail domain-containing protein, partial [Planctomycetes bacterium]|nr:lamin tail domain-containing protein [Planctomycetota bacterium]